MVCIMEDDKEALCVVRDFSGISHDWKVELLVSASTTGKQFLRDIADRYNFEPDSFRLVSPTPSKKDNIYQAVITKDSEETLKDIGINFGNGSRNLFIVEGLDGGNPRLIMKNDDLELGASASPEEPSSSNSSSPPLLTESSYRRSYRESKGLSGYRYPGSRSSLPIESFSSNEYRGLVNQAMTCYLNSLLQALFMTPEFRNALYNWRFIPSSGMDESKSIPYQLQKLFLNLQTSPRDAVETTELTRSFGWDSSEAWQQHDVQELCRVMFDALEHEFKGTEQADLINGLYQGKMIDYVKCLECGTEKSREDTFLDIPLPVRPFGSSTAYGSVEEALRAFVQPELLEGNNQYFCEKCNKKCNAHKGLKFSRFPYLLTLHLMRFDFDYNTMHRIKLSDKVSFPQTLNLNNFIPCTNITPATLYKEEGSEGFPEEITGSSSKCDDSSTTDSGSALDDESCMASSNDNVDYEQEVDEGIDVSNQIENEKNRNHNDAESGPYVYELFSIMVHSGSAAGGHYYAYIKDFETGCWYCFNDQQVYRINSEQIETSFGGCGTSRGFCSSAYSSSMNAYMLMYRQIDKERNVLPLKEDKFPPHIKALLKEMNEKAKVYWKSKEKEREMCKIKVYVDHPVSNKRIDCKIDCETREPLKEVVQKAYKKLQLESAVPLELCRLVLYNSNLDSVDNSLEGKENEEIGVILSSYGVVRKNEMLMEIRSKDTPFRVYKPNSVPLKILLVKLEQNRIENPIIFRTSVWSTVEEFRNELYQHFGQDPSKMNMFVMVEITGNIVKFIEKDDSRLKDCSSELPNAKIFVSFEPFEYDILKVRKAMRMVVQQYFNIVRLNIILPDIKPEILKKWSIPTLSEYNSSTSQKISEEILAHEKVIPHSDTPNEECEITINGIAGLHNNSINNNINSVSVLSPSLNTSTSSTDETCPSEIPLPNSNIAPVNIGGHHSDQSASEDSSLTDSDRTIVGDPQEDYLMSSSGSSPRAGDIRDRLNNDWDGNYFDTWNRFNDDSDNDYYFKELCNSVTIDKKKNIKIEVDKRMSIDLFKKNLEQYVQAPSSCFKIFLGDNEFPLQMINNSLKLIENDTTLYVKLSPPLKPNTLKVKLFVFDYNASKIDNFIDEFPIDEEKTVGETKADLIPFLKSVHNLNIDFERCRLRVLSSGMRRVCLNHEVWSNLKLENDCHLYIQELNSSESIVEPDKQIDLLIRRYHPVTRNCDPIQEIVLEDFTAKGLRAKISEVSDIPEENLTLILQEITQRPSYFRVESDMDSWNAITDFNFEEKWSIISKEVNYLINYKDSKEESNDDAFDRKRVKKMIRHEKPLRIQHNKRNVAENVSSS